MAPRPGRKTNSKTSGVVIRREEAAAHAHHGGAWKVAYADFVTAMMAFFLLLWLINATTEDQRKGLADYFSPSNLMSHNSSGTGQPFGGHTAMDNGALVSDRGTVQITVGQRPVHEQTDDDDDPGSPATGPQTPPVKSPTQAQIAQTAQSANRETPVPASQPPKPASPPAQTPAAHPMPEQQAARETRTLQGAAEQIKQEVQKDSALAGLAEHLAIDVTPEGLRIQLLDSQNQAMFATGSAHPNEAARLLLAKIAPVLNRLPERVSIVGHTDAAPYPSQTMTNWELSAGRANAARRLLVEAGLPERRLRDVSGEADHELLLPADPLAAANRRIAIMVLRDTKPSVAADAPTPPH
jgi:chemotaxis protein MotB